MLYFFKHITIPKYYGVQILILIEFVHAYQFNISLARISFPNNFHVFKLLMFDMQYLKNNNICSTWKVKEKLQI